MSESVETRYCPACKLAESLAAWRLYKWGNTWVWEHRCGRQEPGYQIGAAMLPSVSSKDQIGEE